MNYKILFFDNKIKHADFVRDTFIPKLKILTAK